MNDLAMKRQITDQGEMEAFVQVHLAHRLTSLMSPIVRPQYDEAAWGNSNDTYRAAKEGSYVMLRLFIEFLGVKGNEKIPGELLRATPRPDDLRLDAFEKWGAKNLEPSDFGKEEALVASTHRTLCKINAHFTYDDQPPDWFDRIATLSDAHWVEAAHLILGKLYTEFYQKVRQPIIVHKDLREALLKAFPAYEIEGGRLERM